jgi:signal transduction histidine kinase
MLTANTQLGEEAFQKMNGFLYVQIAFVICIQIVQGRSNVRAIEIKTDKLNIRLSLIRYISHDIRTPLNTAFLGIKMITECANNLKNILFTKRNATITRESSDLIKSSRNNDFLVDLDNILETTELIHTSCTVALETLDEMLTFDKIDENKLVIELKDLKPLELVNEVMKPFQLNARNAEVVLSLDCKDSESSWFDNYLLKADKFKLNQVLRNFLSNALKFTPPSGTVAVIAELLDSRKSYHKNFVTNSDKLIRISVKDTGFGISKENQSRLFGQYVQFNANSLQQGKGSGLGLWISKSKITIS